MLRCPREMGKGHRDENNLGNLERGLHYHRREENTVANQMEQIEMRFHSSVNTIAYTGTTWGAGAKDHEPCPHPLVSPLLDINTIQKQGFLRS